MVKAPIVSHAGDHKRQDLRILPANRHFIAAATVSISRGLSDHAYRVGGPGPHACVPPRHVKHGGHVSHQVNPRLTTVDVVKLLALNALFCS